MSLVTELERILALPVAPQPTPEWVANYSRAICTAEAWTLSWFKGLLEEQAFGHATYTDTGTLAGIIGAGGGKTTLEYGCAHVGFHKWQRRRILFLTTNAAYPQVSTLGIEEARQMIGYDLPTIPLHGKSKATRMRLVEQYDTAVFVMPYSYLSQVWSEDLLAAIDPDMVIADEAHNLRNVATAAGPRRLLTAMQNYQVRTGDRCHFIPLSGTMSEKGLFDTWRLFMWALTTNSPIPIQERAVLDLDLMVSAAAGEGEELEREAWSLISWAQLNVPAPEDKPYTADIVGVRRALQARIVNSYGVVKSSGDLAPGELHFHINRFEEKPSELCEMHMKNVALGEAPTGDEIEYGLHKYRWNTELSSGMYNDLYWDQSLWSKEDLKRALEHHDLKNDYAKLQRKWLEVHPERGLDSPLLLRRHLAQHDDSPRENPLQVDYRLYEAWIKMKNAEFPNMPVRSHRTIWVSDHRLINLTRWTLQQLETDSRSIIIWCENNAFRYRLTQFLLANNINAVDLPSGNPGTVPSFPEMPEKQTVYCAMRAGYNTGLNWQHGHIMGFGQWCRSAGKVEQSIARQHRPKNPSDQIHVHSFHENEFDDINLAATLTNSAYAVQTFGTKQRLMVAAYSEPPKIYPRAFLAERVPKVKDLSPEAEAELFKKFAA